jgi:hypothetical protein
MPQLNKITRLAILYPLFTWAQAPSPAGTPVQITITVGHNFSHDAPILTRDDLAVTQLFDPLLIMNLVPLRGDRAGLDLFLLVDNCSNCEPGSKFEELRRFIDAQPSTTAVGVASIQNGRLKVIQNPTPDRGRAVQALSAPTGSTPASPFAALRDLIRNWPQGSSRRAVLLISNGIDPAETETLRDSSAEAAIEEAQRSGVTVYAIYHPSADYGTADASKIYSGQVQLAHVANETGGEAYFLTFAPLPSLAPFLADVSDHLANRYLLEFLATPGEGAGEFQQIIVKSKLPEVELMAPDKVWVPERVTGSRKPRP